jgi:hypothetical protein
MLNSSSRTPTIVFSSNFQKPAGRMHLSMSHQIFLINEPFLAIFAGMGAFFFRLMNSLMLPTLSTKIKNLPASRFFTDVARGLLWKPFRSLRGRIR